MPVQKRQQFVERRLSDVTGQECVRLARVEDYFIRGESPIGLLAGRMTAPDLLRTSVCASQHARPFPVA